VIDLLEQDIYKLDDPEDVDEIILEFPRDQKTSKMKNIYVKFYGITSIVSDIGGYYGGVTGIFFLLFSDYLYKKFIKELSKNSDESYVREKLSFSQYLDIFDKVENIENQMSEIRQ
jgi:hypothetical protein